MHHILGQSNNTHHPNLHKYNFYTLDYHQHSLGTPQHTDPRAVGAAAAAAGVAGVVAGVVAGAIWFIIKNLY